MLIMRCGHKMSRCGDPEIKASSFWNPALARILPTRPGWKLERSRPPWSQVAFKWNVIHFLVCTSSVSSCSSALLAHFTPWNCAKINKTAWNFIILFVLASFIWFKSVLNHFQWKIWLNLQHWSIIIPFIIKHIKRILFQKCTFDRVTIIFYPRKMFYLCGSRKPTVYSQNPFKMRWRGATGSTSQEKVTFLISDYFKVIVQLSVSCCV